MSGKDKKIRPLRQARLRKGWTQRELADFAQVSLSSVERGERGETLRVDTCKRLCNALGKELPGELDLLFFGDEEKQTIRDIHQEYDVTHNRDSAENDDMNRRQALQVILGATTGSVFLDVLEPDMLDRLSRAFMKPSRVDETMLVHLEALAKSHWQLHASAEGVAQYRRDMLYSVFAHLQTLLQLLRYSHLMPIHQRFSYLISEATQLIGEILFFDERDAAYLPLLGVGKASQS